MHRACDFPRHGPCLQVLGLRGGWRCSARGSGAGVATSGRATTSTLPSPLSWWGLWCRHGHTRLCACLSVCVGLSQRCCAKCLHVVAEVGSDGYVKASGPQLSRASFSTEQGCCLPACCRGVEMQGWQSGQHLVCGSSATSSGMPGFGLRCSMVICHNLIAISEAAACCSSATLDVPSRGILCHSSSADQWPCACVWANQRCSALAASANGYLLGLAGH